MAIKVEAEKFYETESGRIVGPMKSYNDTAHDTGEALLSAYVDSEISLWRKDGRNLFDKEGRNIISEWVETPSPIRTRREIVPGWYGGVLVCDETGHIQVGGRLSPDELREAAHIFNQIAEVLEERAG